MAFTALNIMVLTLIVHEVYAIGELQVISDNRRMSSLQGMTSVKSDTQKS